ncbi:hypothetical protein F5882DRAFT_417848 [Hyaloscypha sp. PMI_1271]|nr:hypothetical protein F5882DRAFT_417848 [Hyaloscypha sp. PMI_1271]
MAFTALLDAAVICFTASFPTWETPSLIFFMLRPLNPPRACKVQFLYGGLNMAMPILVRVTTEALSSGTICAYETPSCSRTMGNAYAMESATSSRYSSVLKWARSVSFLGRRTGIVRVSDPNMELSLIW